MKYLFFILCMLTFACVTMKQPMPTPEEIRFQKAVELAHRFIITDTHIDLPWRLSTEDYRTKLDFLGTPGQPAVGDFDYLRAIKGGLNAPFMSIYIPSSYQTDLNAAKAKADSLIDMVKWIITAYPHKFGPGDSPQLIEANFKKGLISLPMGMENGAPLATLADLHYFYDRGVRYVTLTHGKDNHICDSSYDTTHTWRGLSPYGIELVREMNKIGMMVDVSHISDPAFYKVMEISKAPVIASHSACRYFTPGWERNMNDDMIKLLAENGGVIQVNFGSDFLDAGIAAKRKADNQQLDSLMKSSNLMPDDPTRKQLEVQFRKDHPVVYASVRMVADHIDHIRQLVGIEHVGIGSDFDGLGDSLPDGLKDVSMYPNLIAELLKRGYAESEIEDICYKNMWRVWNKVNEIAYSK